MSTGVRGGAVGADRGSKIGSRQVMVGVVRWAVDDICKKGRETKQEKVASQYCTVLLTRSKGPPKHIHRWHPWPDYYAEHGSAKSEKQKRGGPKRLYFGEM